jgi:hypothetical protein
LQAKFSLTEGSIPRVLLRFSLPILFGNVLQSINGSVNAVWVGKYLGEAAFAAAANSNVVMFLLFGVMFGFSMASTVMVAQCVGAKNIAEAKRVVGTSAVFFLGLFLPPDGAAIRIARTVRVLDAGSLAGGRHLVEFSACLDLLHCDGQRLLPLGRLAQSPLGCPGRTAGAGSQCLNPGRGSDSG